MADAQGNSIRSVMEGEWVPASIEVCRIINVNIEDWSVDVVSEYGNKRYFDIQVMSPYFHFNNAEGFYVQPELGAFAWLCRPSMGRFAAPFLMGYMAPFDEDVASFRNGRQSLNPGDMMMRTRDENFVILRRGGVVQIGSTPICQSVYVPINNIIRHFCEKWEIRAFGGEMLWETWRREQSSDEDPLTTYYLNVKDRADKKGHVARLSIGSHGDSDPLKLQLTMYPDSEEGAEFVADLQIDKDGNITWDSRKDWTLVAKENISMATEEKDITFDSAKDFNAKAAEKMNLESGDNHLRKVGADCKDDVSGNYVLNCSTGKLGSDGSSEPVVLGTQLKIFLNTLLSGIAAMKAPVTASPGSPSPLDGAIAVQTPCASLLDACFSQKMKTE